MEPQRGTTLTKAEQDKASGQAEDARHEPSPGIGFALPGLATKQPMQEWEDTWGTDIDGYIDELTGKTLTKLMATYPGLRPALEDLRTALKDPKASASSCRAQLENVRAASRKPNAHPAASSFPTTAENNLIEYVNAKVLWERGDTSLTPGKAVITKNKKDKADAEMKPDYMNGDGGVGDCVRIKKPAASETELITNIAGDVTDKLTTYPELDVRVVVDMTGSGPGAASLAKDLPKTKALIVEQLKKIDRKIISRTPRVDVVLPGEVVVQIDRADLA